MESRLPVRLLLVEEVGTAAREDARGVKVTSFFGRGSGAGAATHTHKVCAPFPAFARGGAGEGRLERHLCMASSGVTRGCFRFEVHISAHTQVRLQVPACKSRSGRLGSGF